MICQGNAIDFSKYLMIVCSFYAIMIDENCVHFVKILLKAPYNLVNNISHLLLNFSINRFNWSLFNQKRERDALFRLIVLDKYIE